MPLDITFTLSDRDLERFKTIVGNARNSSAENLSTVEIEKSAYKIVDVAMNSDLPDFIADRLLQLKVLLDMMNDEDWGMGVDDKNRILTAMTYFADPIDLIPDHIPGIGFLDDAMFVEIVIRELSNEIEAYNEFCDYRNEEEQRLSDAGTDTSQNRDSWLGEKREELQHRIRQAKEAAGDEDFLFHIL
jgi:uncharacterized membrane protein YkvA (DUF1232 family)